MNTVTVTLGGVIGVLLSLPCWASFFGGVSTMIRTIRLGQPAPDRWRPFIPRFKQMVIEFIAHARMAKFRTVGWAHWLVMIGFLLGMFVAMEAYIQTFDPASGWPIVSTWPVYHFVDEILGIVTVVGVLTLIVIRQLNHPRTPERLSHYAQHSTLRGRAPSAGAM